MLFGLVGASRNGKTTLAKAIAEELGIEFLPSSITATGLKYGFDTVANLDLEQRMILQTHLLEDHIEMLQASPRPLILDRTPIDMIGYLMAEFGMHSHLDASDEVLQAAEQYKTLCLQVTVTFYDFLFVIGQLPNYEAAPGKPVLNRAYQTHTQLIMEGALATITDEISYATIYETEFEARREYIHDTIVERINQIDVMRRTSLHVQ